VFGLRLIYTNFRNATRA